MVTNLFNVLFETDNGREYLKRNFKKKVVITLFLRNHLQFCTISNLKGLMLRKEPCMSHVNDNDNVHIKLD